MRFLHFRLINTIYVLYFKLYIRVNKVISMRLIEIFGHSINISRMVGDRGEATKWYENIIFLMLQTFKEAVQHFDIEPVFVNQQTIENLTEHLIGLIDCFLLFDKEGTRKNPPESPSLPHMNNFLTHNYNHILTILDQTVNATVIAINRIRHDYDLIRRLWLNDGVDPHIASINWVGSDRHKQGHEVLIVSFRNGNEVKKIVYKPTPLEVSALLFGKLGTLKTSVQGFENYPQQSLFAQFYVTCTDNLEIEEAQIPSLYQIVPRTDTIYRHGAEDVRNHYGYTDFLPNMSEIYNSDPKRKAIKKNAASLLLSEISVVHKTLSNTLKKTIKQYFSDKKNKANTVIILGENIYIAFRDKDAQGDYLYIRLNNQELGNLHGAVFLNERQKFIVVQSLIELFNASNAQFPRFLSESFNKPNNQKLRHFITDNVEEIQAFWENAGRLVAFMYFFGINDGHIENFIVSFGHFFIIDSETSLSIRVNPDTDSMTCLNVAEGGISPIGMHNHSVYGSLPPFEFITPNKMFYFDKKQRNTRLGDHCQEWFNQGLQTGLNVLQDRNFSDPIFRSFERFREIMPLYVRYTPIDTGTYERYIEQIIEAYHINGGDTLGDSVNEWGNLQIDGVMNEIKRHYRNLTLDNHDNEENIFYNRKHVLLPVWRTFNLDMMEECLYMNVPVYYTNIFHRNLLDFRGESVLRLVAADNHFMEKIHNFPLDIRPGYNILHRNRLAVRGEQIQVAIVENNGENYFDESFFDHLIGRHTQHPQDIIRFQQACIAHVARIFAQMDKYVLLPNTEVSNRLSCFPRPTMG